MDSNVNFKYLYADLESYIDGETSRHGAELRLQDGGSAYDILKVHTRDWPTIRGYMADALHSIETSMGEDAVMASVVEDSDESHTPIGVMFRFTVPDADMNTVPQAKHELARYVTLSSTGRWLERKGFVNDSKPLFQAASESLSRGISILRTRRRPARNDL